MALVGEKDLPNTKDLRITIRPKSLLHHGKDIVLQATVRQRRKKKPKYVLSDHWSIRLPCFASEAEAQASRDDFARRLID